MNETTHTPGPWMMNTDKEVWHTLGPGGLVAVVVDQQDAHIVAAAPDLLAACELALRNAEDTLYRWPAEMDESTELIAARKLRDELRAAIAKAKGGAV